MAVAAHPGVFDADILHMLGSHRGVEVRVCRSNADHERTPLSTAGVDHDALPVVDPRVVTDTLALLAFVTDGKSYSDVSATAVARDARLPFDNACDSSVDTGIRPEYVEGVFSKHSYFILMYGGAHQTDLLSIMGYMIHPANRRINKPIHISCDFVLASVSGHGRFMFELVTKVADAVGVTLLQLESLGTIRAADRIACTRFFTGNKSAKVSSLSDYYRKLGFIHSENACAAFDRNKKREYAVDKWGLAIMSKCLNPMTTEANQKEHGILPPAPFDKVRGTPSLNLKTLGEAFLSMYELESMTKDEHDWFSTFWVPTGGQPEPFVVVGVQIEAHNRRSRPKYNIRWLENTITPSVNEKAQMPDDADVGATFKSPELAYLNLPMNDPSTAEEADHKRKFRIAVNAIRHALVYTGYTRITRADFRSVISYVNDYNAEFPAPPQAPVPDPAPAPAPVPAPAPAQAPVDPVTAFTLRYTLADRSSRNVVSVVDDADGDPRVWPHKMGFYVRMSWRRGNPALWVHAWVRVIGGAPSSCMLEWDTAQGRATCRHRLVFNSPSDFPPSVMGFPHIGAITSHESVIMQSITHAMGRNPPLAQTLAG